MRSELKYDARCRTACHLQTLFFGLLFFLSRASPPFLLPSTLPSTGGCQRLSGCAPWRRLASRALHRYRGRWLEGRGLGCLGRSCHLRRSRENQCIPVLKYPYSSTQVLMVRLLKSKSNTHLGLRSLELRLEHRGHFHRVYYCRRWYRRRCCVTRYVKHFFVQLRCLAV